MQQDLEAITRLTVQTWKPSTPSTRPDGPETCPHCDGLGLGTIEIEGGEYQIFCECRLREWEWEGLRHWRGLSSPPRTKLPTLEDIQPWSDGARWQTFEPAIKYAKSLLENPVDSKWLTMMGGVGTGKTMLMLALYHMLPAYSVYLGAGDLTSKIFDSFQSGDTEELTTDLARVPILLLDDYGVDTSNRTIQNKIMQIIDLRYRMRTYRPTVVATNLNRDELLKSNQRVASRLLDEDLCKVVSIRLPDYRRRSEPPKHEQPVVRRRKR